MRIIYLSLLCGIILLAGGQQVSARPLASPALSSRPLQEIRTILESGGYDLAATQAAALGSADGLVLAAEALNAKLFIGQAESQTKTAKRAMKLAKSALVLEPKNAEAQFQYALAYGLYGRYASNFKAWRKNLPQKIRAEIDKAGAMAPEDARIEALRGAWHLNLLARASDFDVEKRYGANKRKGIAHFQKALANSQGDDLITHSSFLMLQFVLEPTQRLAPTKHILKTVMLAKKPGNDIERQILLQMQGVYAGFETGDALKRAEAFLEQ